jgi:hypothetical protein
MSVFKIVKVPFNLSPPCPPLNHVMERGLDGAYFSPLHGVERGRG